LLVRVRFDKSAVEAGQLIALPSLMFTFLIPGIGYFSDRYFKNSRKLLIGVAFFALSLSHLKMLFSKDS
jgi:MFS family permease